MRDNILSMVIISFLSFLLLPFPAMALLSAPWPMGQGNPQHTNSSPYATMGNPGDVIWRFNGSLAEDFDNLSAVNFLTTTSPIIGIDGTIYFANSYANSTLYAVDMNGMFKWNYSMDTGMASVPAIDSSGQIYFVSEKGILHAINSDGMLQWTYPIDTYMSEDSRISLLTIDNFDNILVMNWSNYLFSINNDGKLNWKKHIIGWKKSPLEQILSTPSVDNDGNVYIDNITGLNKLDKDGNEVWFVNLLPSPTSKIMPFSAIDQDGVIYMITTYVNHFPKNQTYLYAINSDGTIKWTYEIFEATESHPAIGQDGTIYICDKDISLYAINKDGTLKWKQIVYEENTDLFFHSPIVSSDNVIYLSVTGKNLDYDYGHPNRHSPGLYSFFPNGTIKWNNPKLGDLGTDPVIGSNGVVYHVAFGALYAFGWSSDKSTVPPKPPTMPKAEPADDSVDLTWQPPVSGVSDAPRGYNVYRKAQDSDLTFIGTVNGTATTSFKDNTVEIEGDYTYVVTSINNMGESGPSGEITAHYKPPKEPVDKKGGWSQLPGFEAGALFIAMAIVVAVLRKRRE